MSPKYDVAIVGAGLVGLTLASLLLKSGLRVALIETHSITPIPLAPDVYHSRVSAINIASKELFCELKIWEEIQRSSRLSAFEKMYVWDSLGRGEIQFDATEIAQPCLGYILENPVLHNALLHHFKHQSDLTVLSHCHPTSLRVTDQHIAIQLAPTAQSQSTEQIHAELLVGADGAHSWVREQAQIKTHTWSYYHQALITTVKVASSHQKTAWQCFLPTGPLALLPLYDQDIGSVVWSAPPEEVTRLAALSEERFNIEISRALEYRLGEVTKIAPIATAPLYMRHAKNYIRERVALVGDAAHTLHPLAGQGVNLGFADAYALAQHVLTAKQIYNDSGHYLQLRKYERHRKSENWTMILGMECLKRLFQSDNNLTVQLRSLGLSGVNKLQFLKNQFAYKALGR